VSVLRRPYLRQIDLVRIVPMVGVVTVHTVSSTQPAASVAAGALLTVLHVNRELFFLVTSFVLAYSAPAAGAPFAARSFWRRRYPLVVVPYLAWTLIYWLLIAGPPLLPPGPALGRLGYYLLTGYWQLYFLLVTMQIYLVFPLLLWAARRTRPWHGYILLASLALQVVYTLFLRYPPTSLPLPLQIWFTYPQIELPSYQFYAVAGLLAAEHFDQVRAWLRGKTGRVLAGIVAAAAGAEAVFLFDVAHGRSPDFAAGVFQPAMPLLATATLAGLYLAGNWLVRTQPADGRLWRAVSWAARASFGVYLAHVLALTVVVQTGLLAGIGLSAPSALRTMLALALTLAATGLLVEILGRTPLSAVLTGRPRPRTTEKARLAAVAKGSLQSDAPARR
jgi:peptidoglycan/LPS O-acetylase OafA/YrhL